MTATPLEYLRLRESQLVEELKEFVRIPSQSGDPACAPHIQRAAAWAADRLRRAGLEHVSVLPTGGHPAVYADWLHAPGAPTALIYGHFDVQPPEPLALWTSPPYEPEIRDGRLFGRGASDDKGGVLSAIAGIEAVLATEKRLGINVRFCIEGEEEVGSPNFSAFLARERARLACDLVVSADGGQWSADQPQVVLSLRGGCGAELHVTGPARDLHSGLHGGAVLNPLEAISRLLASMREPDGRIAVAGFYDDVQPLSPRDREQIARVPLDEAAYQTGLGIPAVHGEPGFTVLERRWIRPTLEINGLWGGHTGAGPKTVIPAEAHAKIHCRLVAAQDPDRIFEFLRRHVEAHTPAGVRATLTRAGGRSLPYLLPAGHPANRIATDVLTEVYGVAPFETRVGGSIPVLPMFQEVLGAPAILFGASTDDANIHSPDEFVYLRSLHRAARCFALLPARLAAYRGP
jgi:acetylornithine deacetylase/succinyl-diaminopimelate desuccinylase-like protein